MDVSTPEEPKKREHGVGPMAGIVIIVLILLAGGIYFFLMEAEQNETTPNSEQASL